MAGKSHTRTRTPHAHTHAGRVAPSLPVTRLWGTRQYPHATVQYFLFPAVQSEWVRRYGGAYSLPPAPMPELALES
jgi:hypothetical protein